MPIPEMKPHHCLLVLVILNLPGKMFWCTDCTRYQASMQEVLTNRTMYKSDGSNYMLTCTKIVYGMTIVSEREREREREREEGEGERAHVWFERRLDNTLL